MNSRWWGCFLNFKRTRGVAWDWSRYENKLWRRGRDLSCLSPSVDDKYPDSEYIAKKMCVWGPHKLRVDLSDSILITDIVAYPCVFSMVQMGWCGARAWKTSLATCFVSLSLLFWPTQSKVASRTSTELWCVVLIILFFFIYLSFIQGSEQSKEMYSSFLQRMRELYRPDHIKGAFCALLDPNSAPQTSRIYTSDGKFGAMMNVSLINDGPVTFTLDSRKFEYVPPNDDKIMTTNPWSTGRTESSQIEGE